VDRDKSQDAVQAMAQAFAATDAMMLAVAPEGTRGLVKGWRSGFYHIARLADVPIIFAVMDYGVRTIKISGEIAPSGDYDSDLAAILTHYQGARGRHAGKFVAKKA
jgi:1-acyl-sn-glycerol-3-phosphate acyltransferase